MMNTEIAVVGAGPAGSTAAEVAARLGAEVTLIDRKAEIGSPVQCGGFLPEAHELRALLPRALLPETLVEIPERIMLHRTGVQRIYSPSGRSKEFPVEGRVIDRRNFDRYLVQRAARAGAEVMVSTRASFTHGLCLSGHISGPVDAKVVIGADGPSSSIGRGAGMAKRSEVGVCLEYEMVGVDIDPRAAEMYFGTRCAPGGYAWIIPLGPDAANVGVGVRSSYLSGGAKLRELLDNFVRDHPVAGDKLCRGEIVAIMRGLVPAGGISPSILKGNLLLVGDAAGQVMATSGGGIPLAMVGGRIAGEVAAGHIRDGCGLDEYPSRTDDEMGQELENSVRIRRLVDKVMRSDRLMDALLAMIPPEQMKATQRGQVPESLMRVHDLVAKN
ncbi:MAG: NAD(P)/FAD-dependent oxidoreductase [Euryarchaeota archaeon]|nr:NAD(P)/FAD-dependent oxidoreductase [Euryarchaeota archaeon]